MYVDILITHIIISRDVNPLKCSGIRMVTFIKVFSAIQV